MADDIVTRLRGWIPVPLIGNPELMIRDMPMCLEAADEIERLRAIARYAEHRDNCEQPYIASQRVCNCGLSDLQEARRG